MGAQTLEILRQGVWASLTGGWFYDPHQDVFCNTFHLYLWILLLCFPFSIYLYLPPSLGVYCLYCGVIALVFVTIKLVNHGLHHMFDTAICIQESVPDSDLPESQRRRAVSLQTKTIEEEEGIELQELKPADEAVVSLNDPTDEDSLNSVETAIRPISSTIDLKVDVHRKNSSESSEEARGPVENCEAPVKVEDDEEIAIEDPNPGTPDTPTENTTGNSGCKIWTRNQQRGPSRKYTCACLVRKLIDSKAENCENTDYDLGIIANGSCGVLPQASVNAEQLKNTGSLELPLKLTTDIPLTKKGLLYWKQQHLENSCCDQMRKCDNVGLRPSEISLPSTSSAYIDVNAGESAVDLDETEESKEDEAARKYLEEDFEWFTGEYSDRLPSSSHGHSSQPRMSKFSSDDNIREEKLRGNQTMPCLKFQVNSDEDSSDNAGSRSPLLCRHDSLEKARYTYHSAGSQGGEHKTTKSCPSVGKASKTPLTVYCEGAISTPDHLASWSTGRRLSSKRESFLHGNKKLSLPVCDVGQTKSTEITLPSEPRRLTRERRTDMMSWSTERVGLEWLFEHTDSETDCTPACLWKYTHSEDSDTASIGRKLSNTPIAGTPSSPNRVPIMGLGAIPKTLVAKRPHRHRPLRNKRHGRHVVPSDIDARRETKKQKNERENGIIDEEEADSTHTVWIPQIQEAQSKGKEENKHSEWRENRETYDSSSGSATELSSLLPLSSLLSSLHPPSSPLLAAFLATRRELPGASQMPGIDDGIPNMKTPRVDCPMPPRLEDVKVRHQRAKHNRRRTGRTSRRPQRSMVPLTSVVAANTHVALSHSDTTQGAVHCFEDEVGNLWSYTFDPSGTAASNEPVLQERGPRVWNHLTSYKPQECDSSVNLVSNSNSENESSMSVSPRMPRIVMSVRRESTNTAHSAHTASTHSSSVVLSRADSNNNGALHGLSLVRRRSLAAPDPEEITRHHLFPFRQPPPPPTKHYYKLFYTPWHHLKIRFDRIELMALLDRNLTLVENFLSFLLSVLVALCGILLLSYGFYRDLYAFILCVTIAGCHYSLLKSVQPDASSPTHGYNRVIIFSRAVYFCLTAGVILGLTACLERDMPLLTLYHVPLTSPYVMRTLRDVLTIFLLFFPVLFTFGLFPQVNTFMLYLLEQTDIHVFGGNAASSLIGAIYCIIRSIVTVILIFGFAYGALCEKRMSQHILFSIFVTLVVTWSYHLSRSTSDPTVLWNIVKDEFREKPDQVTAVESGARRDSSEEKGKEEEFEDPLPTKLKQTVHARLINDAIVCSFVAILVFGIHCSSVFTTLQPDLNRIVWGICGCSGLVIHYIIPQLRKQLPWLCLSRPVLRSHEHGKFEVLEAARVMWFEKVVVVLCFLERNILYPVLVLAILTSDAPRISAKFGPLSGAIITTVCGVKVMRSSFSQTSHQYLVVGFAALLLQCDYQSFSETFLVDYFFLSIVFAKTYEFLLKVQFVVTYIAPWQITWGSAFHAFAQPFSVPHSAMLFMQAAVSAVLSAPLNPFLGSAIFLVSYVRPVKFWERDYNTKRVDQSNTRLSSHLDRNLGSDDNNLNSIFYEHLTRSLQHSLCGDLMMGRWGHVSQGDCFVLASDYLNCLVHVIEIGNGLVTFQMRGLEFRGTYCQQREVEAISEGVEENEGCCCCEPGHLPNVLSVNAAFSQRWLAWEVTATKYVLEGYSISDNSAASMLQVFEFRKVLVTYYVKGIIWYCIKSSRLEEWLSSRPILAALQSTSERTFVDLDPVFDVNIDRDFDYRAEGITRSSFCNIYLDWIQFCAAKREKPVEKSKESPLVSLCLALSLMARRALGTASHNTVSNVEFFLYGLHALFKGDFRITSVRDEWVFSDVELLKRVVAPAVRMSLKLHQDHFMSPDEYDENSALYNAMDEHDTHLVISHEGDPAWRSSVLSGTPSLLALRHVVDEGADEYKVIMLNKRYLSFRVIKLNRECVRGLWAGQQQELVFLRNRNPERGSIQNAKQALRNMINSSCDQPIGYPIYVSPLTTSYADTNLQISSIIGGPISLQAMRAAAISLWKHVRHRCHQGCSSGSVTRDDPHFTFGNDGVYAMTQTTIHSGYGHSTSGSQSMDSSQIQLGGSNRGGSLGRSSLSGRGSFPTGGKPSSATLVSLAGLLSSAELAKGESFLRERETSFTSIRERQSREDCCRRHEEKRQQEDKREKLDDRKERERSEEKEKRRDRFDGDESSQRVRIVDPKQVFDAINLGRRIDVLWPDENMRSRGGRSHWKNWLPDTGMEGAIVHRWTPNHRDPGRRSHVDKTIVLLRIEERYVPIAECGVELITESEAPLSSQD